MMSHRQVLLPKLMTFESGKFFETLEVTTELPGEILVQTNA